MPKLKDIEVTPPKAPSQAARWLKPLTLPALYLGWGLLAWVATMLGLISVSFVSAAVLIVGSVVTNAYFIGLSHSNDENDFGEEAMPGVQSALAMVWIAIFCHVTFSTREIAVGMYATILMFSLFRLDRAKYYKLLLFAAITYVAAVGVRGLFNVDAVDWVNETPAFLALITLLVACHIFHMQFEEQRSYYVYRNYELQVILQRLTRIAKRDHLTRTYNRRYIMEALAREKSRADRVGDAFSVCILDLDHFKRLNDEFGHVVGDKVLMSFAKRIKAELRGMDTLNASRFERSFGRFGGEEFIAVLPNTGVEGAVRCAERLCKSIGSRPFMSKYAVTVSVGVATYVEGETVPELLSRADAALYEAKEEGRNQVRLAELPDEEEKDPTVPDLPAINQ